MKQYSITGGGAPPATRRPKSIFEDDAKVIAKGREYLTMYFAWRERRASGQMVEPLFKADVAKKLHISEEDAQALMEFCTSNNCQDFGQFEAEYLRSQNPTFLDLDGNELGGFTDPF